MTPQEREKLVEDMARAIACHDAQSPEDCLASEWCKENWICYIPESCAALAIAERAIREDCAKIAEGFEQNRDWVNGSLYGKIRKEVAAAIAAIRPHNEATERERCAKIAEGFLSNRDWVPGSLWGNIRNEIAAAIRSGK